MAADITKQEFGIYGFVLRVRRIGVFEIPAKGVQFLSSPDLDLSREGGRFAIAAAVSRRNVTRFVFRNTLCCHQIGHGNELHYFLARLTGQTPSPSRPTRTMMPESLFLRETGRGGGGGGSSFGFGRCARARVINAATAPAAAAAGHQ